MSRVKKGRERSGHDVHSKEGACDWGRGRTGMRDVVKKHPEPAKMGVHFRADLSGILAVDRAEAVIDTLEQYEVQVLPSAFTCVRAPVPRAVARECVRARVRACV